ncbi:MAG: hypothetical protein GQ565_05380 [Candidatus Aegiribacteria sp.]|nr:hypothetical protein [Candidatus Aegiribacteria sp.]
MKSVEMGKEELGRICFDCNQFFPACMGEATEFGVCLSDEAFESYIDELLEDRKTASCQKLVDRRKFSGEREACKEFEEVEEVEIDDNSPIGLALSRFNETGELDLESLEADMLKEHIRNIDLKSIPVDEYAASMRSSDPEERDSGITNLVGLISFGNKEAFNELFEFFTELLPPTTLAEVHFKLELLGYLNRSDARTLLIPELIDELYQTVSNNTTRQWISEIFRFLANCPYEEIYEPLERMLSDKRFSYRLKAKIKRILDL